MVISKKIKYKKKKIKKSQIQKENKKKSQYMKDYIISNPKKRKKRKIIKIYYLSLK